MKLAIPPGRYGVLVFMTLV